MIFIFTHQVEIRQSYDLLRNIGLRASVPSSFLINSSTVCLLEFGRESLVTIRSCNHLMRIISTYVDNTKKSEISRR